MRTTEIKEWIDREVYYYDPDDMDFPYPLYKAVTDAIYNFQEENGVELSETERAEFEELFSSVWKEVYE